MAKLTSVYYLNVETLDVMHKEGDELIKDFSLTRSRAYPLATLVKVMSNKGFVFNNKSVARKGALLKAEFTQA